MVIAVSILFVERVGIERGGGVEWAELGGDVVDERMWHWTDRVSLLGLGSVLCGEWYGGGARDAIRV